MNVVHSAAHSHGGTKVQKIGLLWKDCCFNRHTRWVDTFRIPSKLWKTRGYSVTGGLYTQNTYVATIVITNSLYQFWVIKPNNSWAYMSQLWVRTTMLTLNTGILKNNLNNASCITYYKTWNPQECTHDLRYVIQRTKLFAFSIGQHSDHWQVLDCAKHCTALYTQ